MFSRFNFLFVVVTISIIASIIIIAIIITATPIASVREPLTLPDYLDALTTVRAVLSALYVLLLEHCSHPDLRGMGSEYGNEEGKISNM